MIVEMISTGEEVLSGQITDTNATYVSGFFAEHGVEMARRHTVGDRLEDLVAILKERATKADVMIVNGGLGPTSDDLSAAAAAEALGEPLTLFPAWMEALERKFAKMGRAMPEGNDKQAMLPASAEIIDNELGTACGFVIRLHKALIYFTPGPPYELKRMMTGHIWPHLQQHRQIDSVVHLKRLHAFGLTESRLGHRLDALTLPDTVTLGYRAHLPTIEIKVMGRGSQSEPVRKAVDEAAELVRQTLGASIFTEDDHSMASAIQAWMIQGGHHLATAESCTGGMLTSQLVDIAGSSAYVDRGFITYTNEAKTAMLGVPEQTIAEHGAVSVETALAMARGALKHSNASHALAITGVAGPGGGSDEKPVGTVAFALADAGGVYGQMLRTPQWGRTRIRIAACAVALDMLRRRLLGLPVFADYEYTSRVAERHET